MTLIHLALKPWVRFVRQCFLKLNVLEGRTDFINAYLAASSVFMRYFKRWHMQEEKNIPVE